MKIKKNKILIKVSLIGLFGISLVSTSFLSSCSATQNYSIKFKLMKRSETINQKIYLKDLQSQNISVKNAMLGSKNINNGNYIVIYGSIAGSDSTIDFRKWLSGGGIENGGGITINPIINSNFLDAFLSDNELNPLVDVLLYIDNPEFNTADYLFSPSNYDPFATYTSQMLLDKYNYDYTIENNLPPSTQPNQIAEFDLLPIDYKNLNGLYIRQDKSAIDYRDFVNYSLSIRPNLTSIVGSDNKISGGIAFSTKNKPTLLGNVDNINSSIASNTTVKALYKYYLEKEFGS